MPSTESIFILILNFIFFLSSLFNKTLILLLSYSLYIVALWLALSLALWLALFG